MVTTPLLPMSTQTRGQSCTRQDEQKVKTASWLKTETRIEKSVSRISEGTQVPRPRDWTRPVASEGSLGSQGHGPAEQVQGFH